MSGQPPLSMLRLSLDAAHLARISRQLGLPPTHEDVGFLVHSLLARLYGESTVQPFRVLSESRRWVTVLGYTRESKEGLRQHAESFADPSDFEACRWEDLAAKPMPPRWEPDRRLGFEVRVCPVVRLSASTEVRGRDGTTHRYAAGSEVDAWLHRRFFRPLDEEAEPSRETAYGDWLRERTDGAVEMGSAQTTRLRRMRLVRRGHGKERKVHVLERPDVTLRGTLTIRDGEGFEHLLAKGIGRHKAFGFGMLLLKPR